MKCVLCMRRPAEVPDRERQGRLVKRLCRDCAAKRLAGDIKNLLAYNFDPETQTYRRNP